MIVGSRIKDLRIGQNLSQQQLGDLLGVSKVSICRYEIRKGYESTRAR